MKQDTIIRLSGLFVFLSCGVIWAYTDWQIMYLFGFLGLIFVIFTPFADFRKLPNTLDKENKT